MAKIGEGDARWIVSEREDGANVSSSVTAVWLLHFISASIEKTVRFFGIQSMLVCNCNLLHRTGVHR